MVVKRQDVDPTMGVGQDLVQQQSLTKTLNSHASLIEDPDRTLVLTWSNLSNLLQMIKQSDVASVLGFHLAPAERSFPRRSACSCGRCQRPVTINYQSPKRNQKRRPTKQCDSQKRSTLQDFIKANHMFHWILFGSLRFQCGCPKHNQTHVWTINIYI